jgi:hypothetical protein
LVFAPAAAGAFAIVVVAFRLWRKGAVERPAAIDRKAWLRLIFGSGSRRRSAS